VGGSGVGRSGVGGSGVGVSGVGTKQITTRFTPTEKKPHDSKKIFSLGTPTESQSGIVNLSMDPETSCTDSSHINLNHKCSNAYDGKVEPEIGHEWASVTAKGEWIKIIFRTFVQLVQLEVWHRCNAEAQAKVLNLVFSSNFAMSVNRTCDGSKYYTKCTGQARFSRYDFSPAIIVDWFKITAAEMCQPDTARFVGFTEVKAMGRFMIN
ncbi:hypothetical protein LSH36_969g00041, partial [Paralvinella palmiformis]